MKKPNIKTAMLVSAMLVLLEASPLDAQNVMAAPGQVMALTAAWDGERLEDGRPKVSDRLLERLKKVTLEEAWAELIELGYHNQYEGDWKLIDETESPVMTGRALTAQFMPARPDLEERIIELGKAEGHNWQQKRTVSWAIARLVEGDVYVADCYGKTSYGTVIGSNLGNGVFENSKRGIVAYGHVRDSERLREIEGFNGWVKGFDPSYMRKTLLTSINQPVRIGEATVLPGDAVLAKEDGVVFIPAHLVEHIVLTSEFTALSDEFGEQRIRERKYTAGEIDSVWTPEINEDFKSWLRSYEGDLPMSREEMERFLEKRNF